MCSRYRIWTFSLVSVISMCRIGMGLFGSIPGPTLLYLAENVDVSVGMISSIFSAKSVGVVLGAIFGGIIKRFAGPNFRHLWTLGAALGIMGAIFLIVPWLTSFWLLACGITIAGLMYGYLDAGLQAQLLQLWGHKKSRPQIQLFHFMYSVGAFIAPQIAEPFLRAANSLVPQKDRCPHFNETEDILNFTITEVEADNVSSRPPDIYHEPFNPVAWCYIIVGMWIIFVSCVMIVLASADVEKRVSTSIDNSGASSEQREEEPILNVIGLFLVVSAFYFCMVPAGNVIYNFIYSVTLCSDLEFSVTNATMVTSVFWIGFGVGRISGVVLSKYLKPRTILIACLSCLILDMVVMSIWGESTPTLVWVMTGVHGFAMSMLYPTCVSWTAEITNVSGTYMFIFNLGNAAGSFCMLPLAGILFDMDPFYPVYLALSLCIASGVLYAIALYVGKRHKIKAKADPAMRKMRELEEDGQDSLEKNNSL